MKALLVLALTVTAAPALAASGNDNQSASSSDSHRVCTRVQTRGGSRISYRRVCLTENQWQERLGPDWRAQLSGRSPEDDLAGLDSLSHDYSNTSVDGYSASASRHDAPQN